MAVEWTATIEGRNEFGDNCRRHQLTFVGLEGYKTRSLLRGSKVSFNFSIITIT